MFELELVRAFDLGEWREMVGMATLVTWHRVVICGRRSLSDPRFYHVYQTEAVTAEREGLLRHLAWEGEVEAESGSEVGIEAGMEAGREVGCEVVTEAGSQAGREVEREAGREAGSQAEKEVGREAGSEPRLMGEVEAVTRVNACCNHRGLKSVQSVGPPDGRKWIAVACDQCGDINLVDLENKHAHVIVKVFGMLCAGPEDWIFIHQNGGQVLKNQILSAVPVMKSGLTQCASMCYIPYPHNALVFTTAGSPGLKAISAASGATMWSQRFPPPSQPCDLLYIGKYDVLLVSDSMSNRLLVLNSADGSILQIIRIESDESVIALNGQNNRLVALRKTPNAKKYTLAYYLFKWIRKINDKALQ